MVKDIGVHPEALPLTPHQLRASSHALPSKESKLRQLLKSERGATAIEYGLIAALIAIACIIAFNSLGLNLADIFNTVADGISV